MVWGIVADIKNLSEDASDTTTESRDRFGRNRLAATIRTVTEMTREAMPVTVPHYLLFSEASAVRPGRFVAQAAPGDGSPEGAGLYEVAGHWRFVLESVDGETRFEASDVERQVSGERLELLAVVRGLEALDQPSRVTLLTPSRYVSRGIRYGLDEWRENQWQWECFGKMMPVKNEDLWRRIACALKIHRVCCRSWTCDPSETDAVRPERSVSQARIPVGLPEVARRETPSTGSTEHPASRTRVAGSGTRATTGDRHPARTVARPRTSPTPRRPILRTLQQALLGCRPKLAWPGVLRPGGAKVGS